jgi:hypothetical protein
MRTPLLRCPRRGPPKMRSVTPEGGDGHRRGWQYELPLRSFTTAEGSRMIMSVVSSAIPGISCA